MRISGMSMRGRHAALKSLFVMVGHSRLKDGVASARLCPAIHVFPAKMKQDVDARHKAGHDVAGFVLINMSDK